MKICPYCQTLLPDEATECPCGNRFELPVVTTPVRRDTPDYPALRFGSAFFTLLGWALLVVVPGSLLMRAFMLHEGFRAVLTRVWSLEFAGWVILVVLFLVLGEGCRVLLSLGRKVD